MATLTIPPTPAAAPTRASDLELVRIHSHHEQDIPPLSPESDQQLLVGETITYPALSKWKTFTIISTVTGITVLNSMQTGIVTVGLPTIGRDLGLSESLILWFPPAPSPALPQFPWLVSCIYSFVILIFEAIVSVLPRMRLFPPPHRTISRRPRRQKSLPPWNPPLRNLHSGKWPLSLPPPTHHLPCSPGNFYRCLSPLRCRNPFRQLRPRAHPESGLCGAGRRTASGVRLGHGVEWVVYNEVVVEVGFLLFCGGELGGLWGCLVGVTEEGRARCRWVEGVLGTG